MPQQIAKQMVDMKKCALDTTCNFITLFQEQTEEMLNLYLDQLTSLPQEGKKLLRAWLQAAQAGNEFFKKMMDDGFKAVESYFV